MPKPQERKSKVQGKSPEFKKLTPEAKRWLQNIWKMIDDSEMAYTAFTQVVRIKFTNEFFIKRSTIKALVPLDSIRNGTAYRAFGKSLSPDEYVNNRTVVLDMLTNYYKSSNTPIDSLLEKQITTEEKDILVEIAKAAKSTYTAIARQDRYFKTLMQEIILCLAAINDNSLSELDAYTDEVIYQYLCHISGHNAAHIKICIYEGRDDYLFREDKIHFSFIYAVPYYLERIIEYSKEGLYFRGHSDSSYFLSPSIFRNQGHRKKEAEMCDELRRLSPQSFHGMNTQLDRLVEMQHYELPTRLLDISSNALIALLFTCDDIEQDDKDGEVIILDSQNNYKYGQSDTVCMLSILSVLKAEEERLLYYAAMLYSLLIKTLNNDIWDDDTEAIEKYQTCLNSFSKHPYRGFSDNIKEQFQIIYDRILAGETKSLTHKGIISIATVSRVLNNSGSVKQETHQAVMRAVRETGYIIKKSKQNQNRVILVILGRQNSNPFVGKVLMAIQQSTESHGFDCVTYLCDDIDMELDRILYMVNYLGVAGAITLTYIRNTATLNAIQAIAPVAQCVVYNEELPCSFFSLDYFEGTRIGMNHLLSYGHKRIALFNNSEYKHFQRQFLHGYETSLRDAGIEPQPEYVMNLPHDNIDNQYSVAFSAASQMLQREERPDAFYCTDEVYAAVVAAALRNNLRVPEDISVLGFGNTIISFISNPKLTTISQDCFELGFSTVEYLIEKIRQPSTPIRHLYLRCELIVRETVGQRE